MTNEEAIQQAENMAIFSIGGNYLVMPITQAVEALMLFRKAQRYEYGYSESSKTHHIGGDLPHVSIEIMGSDVYAEGLINGARKRG